MSRHDVDLGLLDGLRFLWCTWFAGHVEEVYRFPGIIHHAVVRCARCGKYL